MNECCLNCNNLESFIHEFIIHNTKVTYWKCSKFTDDGGKTIRKITFRDIPSSRVCDNYEQYVKKGNKKR